MAAPGADDELLFEYPPILRQYKSGRVERFSFPSIPAGVDPATGVTSKDVVIDSSNGLWAGIFLPPGSHEGKLTVVVYYHGGAYAMGSAADLMTHNYLTSLVAAANVLAVSLEYRLAPEHQLPTAYDDSWEGLKWVASHGTGAGGGKPWLVDHAHFSRVFLAGGSARATIAHVMAVRAGENGGLPGISIRGVLVVHPCFNGTADIGKEATTGKAEKEKAEALWRFIYPESPELDDQLSC